MTARDYWHVTSNPAAHISFSQFGEDLFLEVLFRHQQSGFYVDIGAHDPYRYSNTYCLFRKGWRGINVDMDKKLIARFAHERPNDINIVAAVSSQVEERRVRIFNDPAVNTMVDEKVRDYSRNWKVLEEQTVSTTTLKELLDQHCPVGVLPHLFNVDVEGLDLDVLRGNDWDKYRPEVVLVEIDKLNLNSAATHETVAYMQTQGYNLRSYIHISAFFVRT